MFVYLHGFASGPGPTKAQHFRCYFADCGIDVLVPQLDVQQLGVLGDQEPVLAWISMVRDPHNISAVRTRRSRRKKSNDGRSR